MDDLDATQKVPDIFLTKVPQLRVILETKTYDTRYWIGIHRILKCPLCNSYYFYRSSDQDWDSIDWVAPKLELTLVHLSPQRVMKFLDEFVSKQGSDILSLPVKEKDNNDNFPMANNESLVLSNQYEVIIRNQIDLIQHRSLDTATQDYIVRSLCDHFLYRRDWESFRNVLLSHPSLSIRISASYFLPFSTVDFELAYNGNMIERIWGKNDLNMNEIANALPELSRNIQKIGSLNKYEFNHEKIKCLIYNDLMKDNAEG
jgi:hypothetical protein